MQLQMQTDPDILAIAEFMQARLTADRLVPVAEALAGLAPALWGHFERTEVRALTLAASNPALP